MHIYHTTADGRALVSLPANWKDVPYDQGSFGVMSNGVHTSKDGIKPVWFLNAEFRAVHGGDVYNAVRIRSGYGWSSFEVYKNGVLISSMGGGELPQKLQVYVPVEDALKGGCPCGCCISKADRAKYFEMKDAADKLLAQVEGKPFADRAAAYEAGRDAESFFHNAVAKSQEVK